jgi:hypothetical protein
MDRLIWLVAIALRRLAGAEEGEERGLRLLLHNLRDGQLAVAQAETTLQGVLRILMTVAS